VNDEPSTVAVIVPVTVPPLQLCTLLPLLPLGDVELVPQAAARPTARIQTTTRRI
jgi:hypothetical protein